MAAPEPNIIELGPHSNMTPEQALAGSLREDWETVVIIGYHVDSDEFAMRSSHMNRETVLWLAEQLKLHVLDLRSAE